MDVGKGCLRAVLGTGLSLTLIAGAAQAKDLGDILLQKGYITREELDQAKEEEKQKVAAEESRRESIASKLPGWLSNITPFGDIRTRWEGFYANDLHSRNRFRLRLRAGLKAKITDEIGGGFRLASGNVDDPISTNQTLEKAFTRKPVNLDQAYITLTPGDSFHLQPGLVTVTAGKFGVNAYRTSELVFDDDLSPEGATETLALYDAHEGFLRSIKVNGFQWIVDELSAASDPWMAGGQIIAGTAPCSAATSNLAFAVFHYEGMNDVARSTNSQLATSNSMVKDATGKVIGYKSGFNLVQGGTEVNFPDPVGLRIPAGIFGDIVYNTQADSRNVGFYVGFGVGNAGKDYYHDGLKNPGDWGAAYTYAWVEKDAVPSVFSYSDIDYTQAGGTQKGSTNVVAHILRFDYELLTNLQLTAKAHFINALDRGIANATLSGNQTLVRTQVDAVLKF